jgi:hypothetical protein
MFYITLDTKGIFRIEPAWAVIPLTARCYPSNRRNSASGVPYEVPAVLSIPFRLRMMISPLLIMMNF